MPKVSFNIENEDKSNQYTFEELLIQRLAGVIEGEVRAKLDEANLSAAGEEVLVEAVDGKISITIIPPGEVDQDPLQTEGFEGEGAEDIHKTQPMDLSKKAVVKAGVDAALKSVVGIALEVKRELNRE